MERELYLMCKDFITYADILLRKGEINKATYDEMISLKLKYIEDYKSMFLMVN